MSTKLNANLTAIELTQSGLDSVMGGAIGDYVGSSRGSILDRLHHTHQVLRLLLGRRG